MSPRLQRVLAAVVAVLILIVGAGYSESRHITYESDASVAITPVTRDPNIQANLLGSFTSSGTSGTFVELISSLDTIRQAGVTGVTVTARAVPDTQTIQVSTTGARNLVQPALGHVLAAAIARQGQVGNVWQLQEVASPSAPVASGTSKKLLLLATVILAALGALFVLAVLRRGEPQAGRRGDGYDGAVARGLEPMPLPGPSSPRHVLASEADITFHLEGFRFIPASTTTVLFQIAGYWRSAVPQALDDPVLLLYTRYVVHALPSVASPDKRKPVAGPDSPLWRESYSAPAEVFYRHQRLALRASPDVVVGLPDPVEHRIVSATDRDARVSEGRATDQLRPELEASSADLRAERPDDGRDVETDDGADAPDSARSFST